MKSFFIKNQFFFIYFTLISFVFIILSLCFLIVIQQNENLVLNQDLETLLKASQSTDKLLSKIAQQQKYGSIAFLTVLVISVCIHIFKFFF